MKKFTLLCFSIFAITFSAKAQDGFEAILLADKADSKKLLQAYFNPGMEGFINSMNNGWYHTAKVHKKFGFDISFGLNGSLVPEEKELFSISALNLASVSATNPSKDLASTFAGPNETTSLTVNTTVNGQNASATFDSPGGVTDDLPLNAVPAPAVQLTVGLPFKIDAMVRFIPQTGFGEDEGKINMFGLGIKKEITSWFGPIDKLPLHVSLLAAYTNMDVSYGIDVDNQNLEITDGLTEFELSAYTFQAIASLNFPIINVYGGVGYSSGDSKFNISGQYVGVYNSPAGEQRKNLDVPENLEFSSSGFRSTIGARLSLGFFKLFGAYTLQEYNTISLGAAISIR